MLLQVFCFGPFGSNALFCLENKIEYFIKSTFFFLLLLELATRPFLSLQLSVKTTGKDQGQRDLRSFFVATPVSSKSNSFENRANSHNTTVHRNKRANMGAARKTSDDPIHVLESEEEDLSTLDDLKDDALIWEGAYSILYLTL